MANTLVNTGPPYEPLVVTRRILLGTVISPDTSGQLWPRGTGRQ